MKDAGEKGAYRVKLVRGPFVKLDPNEESCEGEGALLTLVAKIRKDRPEVLVGADLFSGAGGLSLGLENAGVDVLFSVDHDVEAVATHKHHFQGLSVNWDLSDPDVVAKVGQLLKRINVDVLAGGPPCQPFSKAGRSGIRYQVRHGNRDAHDRRRGLWQSYLEVIRVAMPRAVIMENVPDMALDREMFILRTMVYELEQLGYSVEERVMETWRYGVPQFRQRLILIAMRDRVEFEWPKEVPRKTTVSNAIGELPEVEGGWRPEGGADGWTDYDEPTTAFQRKMRVGVQAGDEKKLFDHITRPVRDDDAAAFELMDANTLYSDLPDDLKRYRDDIYDDKYKRLDPNDLSRTITAHIAKDGYWYIHPAQGRTLTVREAARLQTFPDWFRFSGPPSAAFKQIGNAVPPMFAEALGQAVVAAIERNEKDGTSTEESSQILADWFANNPLKAHPWFRAQTRWQVISAEMLLDRAPADQIRHVWPLVARWLDPADTVAAADDAEEIGQWIGREARANKLIELARHLHGMQCELTDADLESLVAEKRLTQNQADIATLVVPTGEVDSSEEPVIVSKGTLRAVARIVGKSVDVRNRRTDGRIAVASVIGFGSQSRYAHLALMEISARICRQADPQCTACPASSFCSSSRAQEQTLEILDLTN